MKKILVVFVALFATAAFAADGAAPTQGASSNTDTSVVHKAKKKKHGKKGKKKAAAPAEPAAPAGGAPAGQ